MRILIVEDNKPQLELLIKLLEEEGFEVSSCTDGAAGLYELDTGAYDLAVLDRMLPELDGVALLRRHREAGGYTPVIMLTALSSLATGSRDWMQERMTTLPSPSPRKNCWPGSGLCSAGLPPLKAPASAKGMWNCSGRRAF